MTPESGLPSAARLLGDGVALLKQRFWLLLGVMGAATALAAAAFAAPLVAMAFWQLEGSPGWRAWAAAGLVAVGAALWLGSWSQAAVFDAALAEQPSFSGSMRRAWPRVGPFTWTCALYVVFVGGGLLLFVIPGLYLAAALSLAPLISLEEGVGGLEACARSLAYARGRWPALAGRLLLIGALGTLPSLVPFVGWLLGGLIAPLPILCLCLLYRAARRAPAQPAARWPLVLGLAGWLPGLWFGYLGVSQLRALWPRVELQARMASRHLDAAKAQQVLGELQSGQAGPGTALDMLALLQGAASGVSVSTAPLQAPAIGAAPR